MSELGSFSVKQGTQKNLLKRLDRMEREIAELKRRKSPVDQLSEISNDMGLLESGEFRSGNGIVPGNSFDGVRIGFPGFTYDGITYVVVGVLDDVPQVGIVLEDGTFLAGAGVVILNSGGIEIEPTILEGPTRAYKFDDGTDEYSGVYGAITDTVENMITLRAREVANWASAANVVAITEAGNKATVYLLANENGGGDELASILLEADGAANTAEITLRADKIEADGIFGFGAAQNVTISGGVVTITKSYIAVSPESGTADNLDSILGGEEGDIVVIRGSAGNTVTLRDGITNLNNDSNANIVLSNVRDKVAYIKRNATQWDEWTPYRNN